VKTCGSCRAELPLTEFNRRADSRDGLQGTCRACNRASARRYYAANRTKHIAAIVARSRVAREAARRWLGGYLLSHPCVDCGMADVRVLDFDHRPDSDKSGDVMRLVNDGFSLRRIQAEVAKCDVRCRNCHAIATYDRLGRTWRDAFTTP
jgi:hypothetical protein